MKNIIISVFFILLSTMLSAQIGINTEVLDATLNIVSTSNVSTSKVLKITNSDNKELFSVQNNGYVGIGGSNPVVKLDLRTSSGSNEVLGIGTTSAAASQLGAGAVRYNDTNSSIEYSDGEDWRILQSLPPKAYVIAQNSSAMSVPTLTDDVNWGGWTILKDVTSSFNASTGMFTAPHTGTYAFSITAVFSNVITTFSSAYLELNFIVNSATADDVKSVKPLPSKGTFPQVGITNKAFMYLHENDMVNVYIWHESGSTQKLSPDAALNTYTITEL